LEPRPSGRQIHRFLLDRAGSDVFLNRAGTLQKELTMASEFERTSKEVGGRHIVVTSWFDEARQIWRASAPQYASLTGVEQEADLSYPSRNEALTHLCRVLARDLPVAQPTQYPRAPRPR
jgi:hypothetical protein